MNDGETTTVKTDYYAPFWQITYEYLETTVDNIVQTSTRVAI